MGSCVSLHRDSESVLKLRFSVGSKNDKLLISSPVKTSSEKVNGAVADVPVKSQWSSRISGSKDETFFDTQPWMESDCEDDFYSINGEFTPSRGNTPVHHSFSSGHLSVKKTFVVEEPIITPVPDPSPSKKRLSELFKESLRVNTQTDEENETTDPSFANGGTPYLSGANSVTSSEKTPNGLFIKTESKSPKSAQCCMPRLIRSRSFGERNKKVASPVHSVG